MQKNKKLQFIHIIFFILQESETSDYVDSFPSRYSFESEKPSDCTGRCILLLLILLIFVFAIILAFFIGRWFANNQFQKVSQNQPKVSLMSIS